MTSERDIVKRLRGLTIEGGGGIEDEAADTITTLRVEVEAGRGLLRVPDDPDLLIRWEQEVGSIAHDKYRAARTATDACDALAAERGE